MNNHPRVPTVLKKKFPKQYRIVTKPTAHAFSNGKRVEEKKVSDDWLETALLSVKLDPDVERYFYEEI